MVEEALSSSRAEPVACLSTTEVTTALSIPARSWTVRPMSDRLRVALLSRRWSVRAGNERMAVELARYLDRRGHQVDVYANRVDETVSDVLPEERIRHVAGIGFDPTAAMLSYAWATRRLVKRLRARGETDVVIGFGHSVVHDVYRLGGGTQAEFLEVSREQPEARGGPILDRVALKLEQIRFQPQSSPLLIAPSERVKQELERHYQVDPARISVIWNGIDLERFSPRRAHDGERQETRKRWGVGDDETVLLFVGQDPERKGIGVAIEVARRLKHRLVYVGRAPKPKTLPQHVIWDGERRDVEACYRSADLMIAPSRYDPFGGAVLEAAACGLPSVATARIGSTERMRGSKLDRLRIESPDDVAAFTDAAEWALAPERRGELREEARIVTRGATREAWGEQVEAVLFRARDLRREHEARR